MRRNRSAVAFSLCSHKLKSTARAAGPARLSLECALPAHLRPQPEFGCAFAEITALPEVAGRTLGALTTGRLGLRLRCRACGREVLITPRGLRDRYAGLLSATVEAFTRAARCETCGAREAQASGWPLEQAQLEQTVVVRRESARGARLDR